MKMSILGSNEEEFLPEDEEEESTLERLLGLSEMFPVRLRNGACKTVDFTIRSIKKVYGVSRTCTWIFFSSSAILFAPVLFEMERHQMDEMTKMQQRQMLLGPNALGPNAAYSR